MVNSLLLTVHSFYFTVSSFLHNAYIKTSMARTSFGQSKFIRDMGSSSHCGLIMAPGQEVRYGNLGKSF